MTERQPDQLLDFADYPEIDCHGVSRLLPLEAHRWDIPAVHRSIRHVPGAG
jgi:hypothetical protein